MPTHRIRIGAKQIKEAKAAARSAEFSTADPLIFADTGEINLKLRTQGNSCAWIVKWNGKTVTLGSPDQVGDADAARMMTREVVALLRAKKDAKAYVTARLSGEAPKKAADTAAEATERQKGRWDWKEMVRQYADIYLSNPRTNSRGETRLPSMETVKEAKRYLLTFEETHHLHDRLLSTLRAGDLEEVRNAFFRKGRLAASRQFVAYSKAALTHARGTDSREAGLEGSAYWWREVKKRQETIPQAKTRFPTLAETARVLYLAEKHRVMSDRKIERVTSENSVCSLWWLALTGQRASAGLKLLKSNILPWPNGPEGWQVVYFPEDTMKGRKAHSLPIPPRVALLLKRSIESSERESVYVFPATRLEGGKTDAHLSRSTPRLLIQRLRGRPADPKAFALAKAKAEKDGEEFKIPVDLLEGIPDFSTHDFRTTFATECGNLMVRGDAVSAVLDHQSVSTGEAPRFAAAITRQAYDFSQRLELKAVAMEAWTNALFAAVDEEWKRHRPRMGFPAPTSRKDGLSFNRFVPWYSTMENWEKQEKMAKAKADLRKPQSDGQTLKRLGFATEADEWDEEAS
ncbi:tyrosine-type recombinase/integrase [Aliihoeflea aestuarii]|uniref:tyrosine-type recombinase/integrase n=1 Tax=Aliihoeflea aestuarii TaxID=453840 RepID=UPI002093F23C|nr:tyrosine-type recombinase/integrase [Aliihoeflea aestuarii]MCO6389953.1 tyrosine-type recombinase/integrase [Aliihoeflea aestuarii]